MGRRGRAGAGEEATAETTFAEAYTLGCEIGDPCWEALALRGLALTDLLELDPPAHDVELARALGLATSGPMPDLFERLQHRSMLQTRSQTGDR